jgi:hypothetical protein
MSFDSLSHHSKEFDSSTGFVEDEERLEANDEDISLDDLLRNKLDRIMSLEMENKEKDTELSKLREEIAKSEVSIESLYTGELSLLCILNINVP